MDMDYIHVNQLVELLIQVLTYKAGLINNRWSLGMNE